MNQYTKDNLKRKKKSKKSLKFCLYIVFWSVLIVFFASAISIQLVKYNLYSIDEAALLSSIEAEQKKERQLKKDLNYHDSDAFVEKVAREQWNYVKPDETLFINDDTIQ